MARKAVVRCFFCGAVLRPDEKVIIRANDEYEIRYHPWCRINDKYQRLTGEKGA
jgi:hypothetical protein